MAELAQHEPGRLGDVDRLERDPEGLRQALRVGLRALARREAGQREGEDVRARAAGAVHRAGGHDQRVGGVESARDPDDDLGVADRPQPLQEAGDLDVVGLEAVLLEAGGVGRHEREALDVAPEPEVAGRRVEGELDGAERRRGRPCVVAPVVVERPHPQALGAQQAQVDVGDGVALAGREPLGLGQQRAVLVDAGLAVPRDLGGRLPVAGRGVDVGRRAACRGRPGQELAVVGAPDRDGAAREVRQHRRPRQRRLGAGRDRDEHVLADLDVHHQAVDVGGGEEQVGAERHVLAEQPGGAALALAGRELAGLVELAVVRQVGLRAPRPAPARGGSTTAPL